MSVNKVILVGRLGTEPESRAFPNGGSICNLRIATSETWKDRQTGERQERTEWHRVVLRNKLGEIAQQYLHKGSQVYIEGRIQTRKWQDQSGQDRYTTESVANEMQMLGSRGGGGGGADFNPSQGGGFGGSNPYFGSTTYNNVHDGNMFYTLNVSIPNLQGPSNARQNQTASIQCIREGEYMIFGTGGINDDNGIAPAYFMAVSLVPGQEGTKLWESTFTPPYAPPGTNRTPPLHRYGDSECRGDHWTA